MNNYFGNMEGSFGHIKAPFLKYKCKEMRLKAVMSTV